MKIEEITPAISGRKWTDVRGNVHARILKVTDGTLQTTYKTTLYGQVNKRGDFIRDESGKVFSKTYHGQDAPKGYKFIRHLPDERDCHVFVVEGDAKGLPMKVFTHEGFMAYIEAIEKKIEKLNEQYQAETLARDQHMAKLTASEIMGRPKEELGPPRDQTATAAIIEDAELMKKGPKKK